MSFFRKLIPGVVGRYLGRLRFPALFAVTALLLAVDVFVPDPLPFVDEILLALGTLMLGRLREKVSGGEDRPEGVASGGSE